MLRPAVVSGLAGNGEDDEGLVSSVHLAMADLVDSVDFTMVC